MDLKVFFSTFLIIFLAELGDKTQFAAMLLGAQNQSKITVLLAVVLALSIAGAMGVLLGSILSNYISPKALQVISGSLFIVFGVWTLLKN